MNKLLLNHECVLNESIKLLEIEGKSTLHIQQHVIIDDILFHDGFETTWVLEKNATLEIGTVTELDTIQGKIHILCSSNTLCIFHLGIRAKGTNDLSIINEITGDHNQSDIKVRLISEEDSTILLKTTGILEKNTKENEFLEDIKYLNEYPSAIICFPELIVNSDDTVANHNMTVGNMDEDPLFYLMSRGISKDHAKEIFRNSFVNSMKRKEEDNEY